MKKRIESLIQIVVVISALWCFGTTVTQAYKCNEMSQTELFLHIPRSFILDFNNCN